MRVASRLIGALALAALGALPASAQPQATKRVDLELVLAVDISRSMDYDEHLLQRNGYVEAFRHKDVINALMSGPEGRIAVTYLEWAGDGQTQQIIGWTIIDSEKASRAFADELASVQIYGERRTSISSALYEAARLIEENDIASHRQVIDVSGDGANNSGPPVEEARDAVLGKKIVINGLPILLHQDRQGGGFGGRGVDIERLDRYYKQCVIGGPAAFIAPVFNLNQLAATIRKKLVLEIAGLDFDGDIAPGTAPVQFAQAGPAPAGPGVTRIQLKLPTEPVDCFAGEKARAAREGGFGRYPDQ